MNFSIQRAARRLILIVPIWLAGCLDITEVRQPASGLVNAPFTLEIDATSSFICTAETFSTTCTGILAVSLPAGWQVESCVYAGAVTGTCAASATEPPGTAPTDSANSWRTLSGEPILIDLPQGSQITTTLQVRPTSSGTYRLDYQMGAFSSSATWGTASMNHPITIQGATSATVTAVPTMSVYGYGLMALALAAVALPRKSRRD